MQFSLDHKRQSHKQNQCLIFTRSIALRFWLPLIHVLWLRRWWKPALNDSLKQSIKICSSSPRWLWRETPKSFSSQAHRKTYKNKCMCCISQVLKIKQCNTKLLFHYPLPQKNTYSFWKKTIKVEPWYNRAKVGKMCSLCLGLVIVSGFFSIFILLLLGLSLFYLCWRCWSNRWIQAIKFSQCRSYYFACGPVAAYYTIGWFCSVLVS